MKANLIVRAVVVVFVATFPAVLGAPSASAATNAGAVRVVEPDSGDPLGEGGSHTPFTLRLPDDAACPGDSEHDQYRIMSFLVPERFDPGALSYDLGPTTEDSEALFRLDSRRYIDELTEPADEPGGEGVIVNVPAFNFAVFEEPGLIKPGRYHVGIACTLFWETKRYWSTELVIAADPEDTPAGIHWTMPGFVKARSDGDAIGTGLAGAMVLGAGGLAIALLRGRPRARQRAREVRR